MFVAEKVLLLLMIFLTAHVYSFEKYFRSANFHHFQKMSIIVFAMKQMEFSILCFLLVLISQLFITLYFPSLSLIFSALKFELRLIAWYLLQPLIHIGGFRRRSAVIPKPWMNVVKRHKAQTHQWVKATKSHEAPTVAATVRKFWNVQNFHHRAPAIYVTVMECGRASSILGKRPGTAMKRRESPSSAA